MGTEFPTALVVKIQIVSELVDEESIPRRRPHGPHLTGVIHIVYNATPEWAYELVDRSSSPA